MIHRQEHDLLTTDQDSRYEHLELVKWDKPVADSTWGYYAYYKIGAEWIDDKITYFVQTAKDLERSPKDILAEIYD
jgi:5-methylcytosine-specific restriction enzyme subunit McrC